MSEAEKEKSVAEVMEKRVLAVDLNANVRDCSKAMAKRGVGCAVVVQSGNALGIVTERDVVSKVIAEGIDPAKVLVRDIMSTPLIVISPDAPMTKAAELMAEYRIRRIVVVDMSGGLRGIITAGDLARTMAEKAGYREAALNALARYKEAPESGPYQ